MKHFLLLYDLATDYQGRRATYRAAHLERAWAAQETSGLILGGALTEPSDVAVLLFEGDSQAAAEAFAKGDPYVTNGLVKSWRVREWATVVGTNAAHPIRLPS